MLPESVAAILLGVAAGFQNGNWLVFLIMGMTGQFSSRGYDGKGGDDNELELLKMSKLI